MKTKSRTEITDVKERFAELEKRRIFPSYKNYLWRLSGYVGNMFFNKKAPSTKTESGLRLLNLGCGERHMKGWVNADFYRLQNLLYKRHLLPNWMVDITKPLNCEDNHWDGVLIEHVNEHILYSHNLFMFKELYRCMKPGGVLRIIVPDLDRYINWREVKNVEPKMARYHSLPEAVSNLTQNHSHISVWNYDLMAEVLSDVGFTDIKRSDFGNASIPEMNVSSESHRWESLFVEAWKKKA